ncbi:unnamed protein product [Rotaria sp. Silwood1]|nr:unnamed protein product [Rotaria sp. Silwood1]
MESNIEWTQTNRVFNFGANIKLFVGGTQVFVSNIQFVENIHSNIMDDCECLLLDSNNQPSSCTQPINAVSFISQLSIDAKRILITIVLCKELVKYVKKMNLNQDLEDRNSFVLLQCTIVRWLSLMNCLESVNKSLVSLDEIFEKKLNKTKLNRINVCLLNKLIDFLKPWEYVIKRIQSSKTPSIHIVAPSICIISSSLETKSGDSKQDKGCSKLPTTRKDSQLSINHPIKSINDFYSNAEDNDEDDIDQQSALRSSSHALEIELYTKQG